MAAIDALCVPSLRHARCVRRYVTPGAFAESALYGGLAEGDLKDWQMVAMVRYHLYKPGGDLARELAKNPTVLVVNDTAFAHGGLLPTHGGCAEDGNALRLRPLLASANVDPASLNCLLPAVRWCSAVSLRQLPHPHPLPARFAAYTPLPQHTYVPVAPPAPDLCMGLVACAVQYGVEKLNAEVSAWMRGDTMPDGKPAAPPMLAIG